MTAAVAMSLWPADWDVWFIAPIIATASSFAFMSLQIFSDGFLRQHAWYRQLPRRKQVDTTVSVVALVHAVIVSVASLFVLVWPDDSLVKDPVYGDSPRARAVLGVAIGYFAWDLFVCVRYGFGLSFLIHAVLCLSLYAYCVGVVPPFLLYYGCVFLIWEISTPFLNARHLMKAAGCGNGPLFEALQKTGFLFFFCARIVFGWPASYYWSLHMFRLLDEGRDVMPAYCYLAANVTLNLINAAWFAQMVRILFSGARKPSAVKQH